ncbi:fungal-specific transcription factor domain-containing protein [Pisolithus croceorrhizus]|nr:fungal-specific transcription factor domain-containing protein [Pisolithus croceorrhizus]
MPPAPTRPKLKHKSGRGDLEEFGFESSHAREIEQKRNSGQISCAECRRLKIKCDKQIPCQSCRRRGCAALCPNGSLSTGQGTRFVLAATEHLHLRMAKMSERIRQLEGALSELQVQHSTEPHPLLRPDLLKASQSDDNAGPPSADDPAGVERTPELLEAFGTLSISNSGAPRFFGPTAGSHCLLMFDNTPSQGIADGPCDSARDSPSPENENFTLALPRKPLPSTLTVEGLIDCHLPSEERALYLTETYVEQASWLFQSVSKDQILLELLPAHYVNGASHVTQTGNNPHRLGLLFLVFAIGALLDPNQEPENVEADRYHQAARAAICLQSVMEKPSLETIQALHLLSVYNAVSGNEVTGKETSVETSWSLVTLAAHLAHTVNRDGLRWGLPPDVTTRRRVVFWDLFVADVWNCLEAGRPPTFSLPYIDCQFPGGGSPRGSWVFRFASDCVAEVAARTLTSDSPSYSTILELDRKICNFPVPEAVEEFVAAASGAIPTKPVDKDIGLMESMGRFVMSNSREVTIVENPVNPLNSPYTPSFLATYRASLTILRTVKMQYELHPKLTARLWPIWTYAFSAAIVFGTIVTHGPRSPMATSAMKELRDAYLLFSKASSRNRRAQKALPIVTKLMEKAQNALLRAQSDIPDELGQQWGIDENERDDELTIFAGRMKIVSMKGQATDRMPDQSSDTSESTKWLNVPVSERQEKQGHVDPAVPQSYSREQLSSTRLQQRGSTIGLEHSREMLNWEQPRYPDASSQSTFMQLPPMALQIHSAPPYPMVSLSVPSTQGYHPQQHRYGQQVQHLPTPSMPSSVSYYDDTIDTAAHESLSTHPHAQPHRRQPIDALPHHQPPHQRPSLPELSQLGLVGQESGLDRRWTSFMRESGFVP